VCRDSYRTYIGTQRWCVRMCGVEELDMCGSACVSVYEEVVGRQVVVCGDGGVEGCGYVWWVVVVGMFGVFGVWRCVEVCGQAQRYVGSM